MIKKMDTSSDSAIGFHISGTIKKEDYDELVPVVEAVVARQGSVNLLLEMTEFKWEAIGAWGADLRFGQAYRKKIGKMAIVGDKRWEKWLAKAAAPFYAEEARYFTSADIDAAWAWVQAEQD